MNGTAIPEESVATIEVLTVGQLLEKLQFENVNDRVCVRVQNPAGVPPFESAICIASPDGNWYDIFTWKPKGLANKGK